jgi:hypothetical protein
MRWRRGIYGGRQDGACHMSWRSGIYADVWWNNWKKRQHFEDIVLAVTIILK